MQVWSIGFHTVLDVSLLYLLNADINFGFNTLGGGSFFAELAQNTGDGEYAFGSRGRFQSLYLALIIYKLEKMQFAWPVFLSLL
jgi:hypothetical protein